MKPYPIVDKIQNSRLVGFHIYNLINPYKYVNKPKHTGWLAGNKKVNVTNTITHWSKCLLSTPLSKQTCE